jgi:hypothetical protein
MAPRIRFRSTVLGSPGCSRIERRTATDGAISHWRSISLSVR